MFYLTIRENRKSLSQFCEENYADGGSLINCLTPGKTNQMAPKIIFKISRNTYLDRKMYKNARNYKRDKYLLKHSIKKFTEFLSS